MYKFVSHTHAHLGGQCEHFCSYCYVDNPRFGRPEKFKGPIRLLENEFNVKYGTGKTIFIEHCNDMFAEGVKDGMIIQILNHCFGYPGNTYVFQTKNPARYTHFDFPMGSILGTTIESDILFEGISKAPPPYERYLAMKTLFVKGARGLNLRKFVTIEPILRFNPDVLAQWLDEIRPEFINIGADSKGHGLPEPNSDTVRTLIAKLQELKLEVRNKHNLERLLGVGK